MSRRPASHLLLRLAVLVGVPLAIGACSSDTRTIIGAGMVSAPSIAADPARITPDFLPLAPIAAFSCPSIAPFTTAFDLIVDGRGGADLILSDFSLNVFDGAGLRGLPVLFDSTNLAARFGDTLVRAGTTRTFRFQPQFGCGLSRPTLAVARIQIESRIGAPQIVSVRVPIR